MIYYGRRTWVPNNCPVCGNTGRLPFKGVIKSKNVLAYVYYAWRVIRKKHPIFGVPTWYGHCGKCAMEQAIMETKSDFYHRLDTISYKQYRLPIIPTLED